MSDVTERLTKGEENDYHPVNQYIDEQSKLRRARSFWIRAKSWALILIAIGILVLLLAWAYSLLDRYYVLKRVSSVQERVIEERVNKVIDGGSFSKTRENFSNLGKSVEALEAKEDAEKKLASEKEKNQELEAELNQLSNKILNSKNELEKTVGEVKSVESEKLSLLNQIDDLKSQLSKMKEESDEKDKIFKELEKLQEKNKNIKNDYYIFSEERIKINNKEIRVMTRFSFMGTDSSSPSIVDCYVDFEPSFGVNLADLEMGQKGKDFSFNKIYSDQGFSKDQFKKVKQENCRFIN